MNFKAWDNKNKRWIHQGEFNIHSDGSVWNHESEWTEHKRFDATLCRNTGLKDKNSVEIFEFDIIKSSTPNFTIIRRVEYSNESASFVLYKIPFDKRFMHNEPIKQDWLLDYSSEVIGNIFDTPHLLEAK